MMSGSRNTSRLVPASYGPVDGIRSFESKPPEGRAERASNQGKVEAGDGPEGEKSRGEFRGLVMVFVGNGGR